MSVDRVVYQKSASGVQIAGFKNGVLCDLEFHETSKAAEGFVYLGRLTKKIDLANGKTGFFVEIGDSREAFINCEEYGLDDLNATEGQLLIVQVAQEQRAEKGARLTRGLQIAGLNLVYCPYRMNVEVSSKITDKFLAEEYAEWVRENMTGQEGWILRTSAIKVDKKTIAEEMDVLRSAFDKLTAEAKKANAPCLLLAKTDALSEYLHRHEASVKKIIVNARNDFEALQEKFDDKVDVELQNNPFKENGLDDLIFEALQKEVRLKSGGRITIEETKACVAIDVDSGDDKGNGNLSRLNMEAAAEIVRQIRLRNLSGKIIIDFAGISEYRYLKNVIDFLQQELQKDVIKTICFGLSRGGNVEIVRMRRRPTLRDILTEECQSCLGTGRVEK